MALAPLMAQEYLPEGGRNSLTVLYQIQFDEDFLFLAHKAGVYIWNEYAGPFPDKAFWHDSVEAVLGSVENIARMQRSSGGYEGSEGGSTEDSMTILCEQAEALGIPVVVDINISGNVDNPRIVVTYTIKQLFALFDPFEGSFEERIPIDEDLLTFFWLPLAADMNAFIEKITMPPLHIRGPQGTTVYGVGEKPLIIPETEDLLVTAVMPGTFSWETRHKKYAVKRGIFFVDQDHNELVLPYQRFYPTSIDLDLSQGRFPELWITRYLKSYGLFFGIGLQQQAYGLLPADNQEPLITSFNALPLIMPGISLGYRFFMPRSYTPQPYVQGTFLVRYNVREKDFDDFSPCNFALSVGYDWGTPFSLRFFADIGFSWYFLDSDYAGSRSKGMEDPGIFQYIAGDRTYIELPTFRLGVKIPLPF